MSDNPAPETLEAVYWRLVKDGLSTVEIGDHPDYRAAFNREYPGGLFGYPAYPECDEAKP